MSFNIAVYTQEWLRGTIRDPKQFFQERKNRQCPCCDHQGKFVSAKRNAPREFRCPNCASRPRDRQVALVLKENNISFDDKNILHIAPEWPLYRKLKNNSGYVGGDVLKRRNANAYVDITDIQFEDDWFDILVCNHVLEHVVDDAKGMQECFRVLNKGSIGIITVPVDLERQKTWEPPSDMPKEEVEQICGWDHKRIYGVDFADKLKDVGFTVETIMFDEDVQEKHRFYNEPVYVVTKQ